MDSLESNLSMFLVDACLEQPIQTGHQFINLTPTPKHAGYVEDWNVCSNSWKNNFTFEWSFLNIAIFSSSAYLNRGRLPRI